MIEMAELLENILGELDGAYLIKDYEDKFNNRIVYDLDINYSEYKLVLHTKALEVSVSTVWRDSSEGRADIGDELDSFDFHEEEEIARFKTFLEVLD